MFGSKQQSLYAFGLVMLHQIIQIKAVVQRYNCHLSQPPLGAAGCSAAVVEFAANHAMA
jgi:hypothetical protein